MAGPYEAAIYGGLAGALASFVFQSWREGATARRHGRARARLVHAEVLRNMTLADYVRERALITVDDFSREFRTEAYDRLASALFAYLQPREAQQILSFYFLHDDAKRQWLARLESRPGPDTEWLDGYWLSEAALTSTVLRLAGETWWTRVFRERDASRQARDLLRKPTRDRWKLRTEESSKPAADS